MRTAVRNSEAPGQVWVPIFPPAALTDVRSAQVGARADRLTVERRCPSSVA